MPHVDLRSNNVKVIDLTGEDHMVATSGLKDVTIIVTKEQTIVVCQKEDGDLVYVDELVKNLEDKRMVSRHIGNVLP